MDLHEDLVEPSLCPVGAVEVAVTDGLAYVLGVDLSAALEVGNGACNFKDAAVGTGREVETLHGHA